MAFTLSLTRAADTAQKPRLAAKQAGDGGTSFVGLVTKRKQRKESDKSHVVSVGSDFVQSAS